MLQQLARTLKLSPLAFNLISALVLLLIGLALGFALRRLFHSYAVKHRERNAWAEFAFSLLEALPIPLLLLAALYATLEFVTLPRRYERLGSELISSFVIVVVYFFPAKVIALFLRRLARKNAALERIAHLLIFVTRFIFLLLALYTLQENLILPRKYERFGSKLAGTLAIVLVFYALARIVTLQLSRIGEGDPALQRLTNPASLVAKVIFSALAIIIVLENFGVHLTAVWTTLGVGSVAVALALQETLSNLFAGLYLLADRPVSPSDYVKLDSGQEGYVARIGWRSTTMRTLGNNLVIVPNAVMAKAVITNYSSPEPRMGMSVTVGVAYGTDPARVEQALINIAQQAIDDGLEGLLGTPAPSVRLIPGFGPSSLDFSLGFQIRQFTDQYLVQSELRKRIVDRFKREGIEITYPTQMILFDKESPLAIAGARVEKAVNDRDLGGGSGRDSEEQAGSQVVEG